jgi:hypothetical protein
VTGTGFKFSTRHTSVPVRSPASSKGPDAVLFFGEESVAIPAKPHRLTRSVIGDAFITILIWVEIWENISGQGYEQKGDLNLRYYGRRSPAQESKQDQGMRLSSPGFDYSMPESQLSSFIATMHA